MRCDSSGGGQEEMSQSGFVRRQTAEFGARDVYENASCGGRPCQGGAEVGLRG